MKHYTKSQAKFRGKDPHIGPLSGSFKTSNVERKSLKRPESKERLSKKKRELDSSILL